MTEWRTEDECCAKCSHYARLERLDYAPGGKMDEPMEGYACTLFLYPLLTGGERIVNWMVNRNPNTGMCEMFEPEVSE